MMLRSGFGILKDSSVSVAVAASVARSAVREMREPGWGTKATSEKSSQAAPITRRRAGRRADRTAQRKVRVLRMIFVYQVRKSGEEYGVLVTFDPKPLPKQAGIGCHTNYSNMATRSKPGGMDAIKRQCEHLREQHALHIANYGIGNERRLTGKDNTASIHDFSWGIGDRSASIRIGVKVEHRDCGYYEDRRPAANMDPYLVSKLLVETTLMDERKGTKATMN